MPTLKPILKKILLDAGKKLESTGTSAHLDAQYLLAHILGMDRSSLLLALNRGKDEPLWDNTKAQLYNRLLQRRIKGEPIAYILGEAEFWSLPFHVSPHVLIPRPETEILVEEAVHIGIKMLAGHFSARQYIQYGKEEYKEKKTGPNTPNITLAPYILPQKPLEIADLGTGSGAIIISTLHEIQNARGIATDKNRKALCIAGMNAQRHGVEKRLNLLYNDWTHPHWYKALGNNQFDLILSNPPYIAQDFTLSHNVAHYEPPSALFAGPEGLNDYQHILPKLKKILSPNGIGLFEIGFDQSKKMATILKELGFISIFRRDWSGHKRVVILTHA